MSEVKWYKGNIHTHTNAGGPRIGFPHGDPAADSDPETVTRWYRRHGYDFLVLSDHNHRTLLEYTPGRRRFRRPLMVPGEEVSLKIHNGTKAIHIGALGISRMVEPIDATEVIPTLQANVDAVREAGGIAAINHPNLTWAFDHEAISKVRGAHLLEIYNGHPMVNVYGAGGRPGYEEIWDGVLSSGLLIWGVATDDSHEFTGEFGPRRRNPGRGGVMVRASRLDRDAILDALRGGDSYASTGVTLEEVEQGPDGIYVRICQEGDALYTTRFVGVHGVTLKEVFGLEAAYRPDGDEPYFRASVISSSGARAWTQPVMLSPSEGIAGNRGRPE